MEILPIEATPSADIDYINETLTGLVAGDYSFNGSAAIVPGTTYPISDSWMGNSLSIVKTNAYTPTANSPAQTLLIPARPAAPNVTGVDVTAAGANDGKITGLDNTKDYEYRLATDSAFTPVPPGSDEITGLAAGDYAIRVVATSSNFAGELALVTLGTSAH